MTVKKTRKTFTLDEISDKFIGEKGTPARKKFEKKLKKEMKLQTQQTLNFENKI